MSSYLSLQPNRETSVTLPEGAQGHDGVEILVQLAKSGQINPWNLDLTAVADQYLQAVQTLKQSDLRITGKVLLFLAILLRMKSDILTHGLSWQEAEEEVPEAYETDPWGDLEAAPLPNVISLETVLKRRTSTRQPRIRPVTLVDLIQELQKIETLEHRQALKRSFEKMERRRSVDLGAWTIEEIETLAHEEFVEDTVETVEGQIEALLANQPEVTLSELTHQLGMDRVTLFLALLFISARCPDLTLSQTQFYGELVVSRLIRFAN